MEVATRHARRPPPTGEWRPPTIHVTFQPPEYESASAMSLAVIACLILGLPAAGADAPAPGRPVANLDQTITLDCLYDPAALYRALGVDPSQESTPTP